MTDRPRREDRPCQQCGRYGARPDKVLNLDLCDPCWSVKSIVPGGLSPQQVREKYPAVARRIGL